MGQSQFFILIVSNDDAFVQECGNLLESMQVRSNQVAATSFEDVVSGSQNKKIDLFLVDSESAQFKISSAEEWRKNHPESQFSFIGLPKDGATIANLIKAGFHSFSKRPLERSHVEPFIAAQASTSQSQVVSSRVSDNEHQVVVNFSPKGGSGVTLITVAMATQLAKTYPNEVAVLSLAPQCGDPCAYMDIESKYTLWDLLNNHRDLDNSYVQGVMQKHKSGVHVLAGPNFDQLTPNVDQLRDLQSILMLLKQQYKYILIDGGGAENYLLQNLLSQSDHICMVGNIDFPSLRGMVNYYNRLMRFGLMADKIHIIVNRYNAKNNMSLNKFEESIDHPIECRLPNNYPLCSEAVNTGKSFIEIDENADISECIRQFVSIISGDKTTKTEQSQKEDSLAIKVAKMILGRK